MNTKCCSMSPIPKTTLHNLSWLKAIADESRLKILHILKSKEHCVCVIVEHLGISQSLTSHHLKQLKDVGLVIGVKKGLWMHYSLTADGKELANFIFSKKYGSQ